MTKRRGRPPLEDRKLDPSLFNGRVLSDTDTGCVEWIAARNRGGYGYIEIAGRQWLAHRAAFTIFKGAIPPGMVVMHICDNPPCCNPDHLRLGAATDNVRDAIEKGRMLGRFPDWAVKKRRIRKLTDEQVREIRIATGRVVDIAAKYGIRHSTVCDIRNGKRKTLVE